MTPRRPEPISSERRKDISVERGRYVAFAVSAAERLIEADKAGIILAGQGGQSEILGSFAGRFGWGHGRYQAGNTDAANSLSISVVMMA
jgi:hypothetical protein